jgi:hypothetical protein
MSEEEELRWEAEVAENSTPDSYEGKYIAF